MWVLREIRTFQLGVYNKSTSRARKVTVGRRLDHEHTCKLTINYDLLANSRNVEAVWFFLYKLKTSSL